MADVPHQPMHDIRGTLIIADHVYQTVERKWIIVGTYRTWHTQESELRINGIHAYVRLQFERPGNHPCSITMVDRALPPNAPPILDARFTLPIGENEMPVFETALVLPSLTIRPPVVPGRDPHVPTSLRALLWLRVSGSDIASCPLDVQFYGPPPGG